MYSKNFIQLIIQNIQFGNKPNCITKQSNTDPQAGHKIHCWDTFEPQKGSSQRWFGHQYSASQKHEAEPSKSPRTSYHAQGIVPPDSSPTSGYNNK